MSETLFIDNAKRKKWGLTVLLSTIGFLHFSALIILIALIRSDKNYTDTAALAAAFSTVMFGIAGTIILLLSDKALDFWLNRLSIVGTPAPASVTETVTRKVETQPSTAPEAKDVNITAQGDVNVKSGETTL